MSDPLQYLNGLDLPQISEDQKAMLNDPLLHDEVAEAVKELNNNKSPGTDGLPIEIYKFFWPKLGRFLFEVYKEILEDKKLHLSARCGIIALLEKLNKDMLYLENWRPLSLLNCDYKILAKVFANRLNCVLPDIIHRSQYGFVKDRHISEDVVKLLNIVDYYRKENKSALLLSFDFHKAFDSMEWSAIRAAMKAFNIGDIFIDMVMILYTDVQSTVMKYGYW